MKLISAEGLSDFSELVVSTTAAELQSIQRAMRRYDEAAHRAGRGTFTGGEEVLSGLSEIFDVLRAAKATWP